MKKHHTPLSKQKLPFTLILSLALILSGCATGKKALQHGNYAEAVLKSVERLKGNPSSKNAAQTLKAAYPLAVQTLEGEIQDILASQMDNKYDAVAQKYEKLNGMAQAIRRSPAALKLIPRPSSYVEQLRGAKTKAAEEAYQLGLELLDSNSRLDAREAYYAFNKALTYRSNYRDALQLAENAKDLATLIVAVEPIPVPGRYKLDSDFFYSELLKYLNSQRDLEFVAFMSTKEAKRSTHTDHILAMDFFDFQVGASKEKHTEKEVTSKDSVKVGAATIEGRKVDVYNKVSAKLTQHNRKVSSSGLLQVKIIDANRNRLLEERRMPGTYVWETDWASYNGDERALTKKQWEMCQKKPARAPSTQDLFYQFTRPIFDQTKSYLKNYYRKI